MSTDKKNNFHSGGIRSEAIIFFFRGLINF